MSILKKICGTVFSDKARSIISRKLFSTKYIKGTPKEIFEHVYLTNAWGSSESASGTGSEVSKTKDLVTYLDTLINTYGIRNIFDVPCGDFNWMKNVDLARIKYTGGDIVEKMIIKNNENYAKENITFVSFDLITDKISNTYDLIITRDCFVHLSFNEIRKSLLNIVSSGSKYLLVTSFVKTKENRDIKTGVEWRPVNMGIAPFNFPDPIEHFVETNTETNWESNKTIALYVISDLKSLPLLATIA